MFTLICSIALINFVLGYALAVQLGLAHWPKWKRSAHAEA
jgi:hypothetical protein